MGDTKKFAVVVFNDDNCVSAVPLSWISDDQRTCQWPLKYPQNFKKLIQDPNSKPDHDWIPLDIELKKRYSSFDAANTKANKYLNIDAEVSSSELEATPTSGQRRRRTKRKLSALSIEPTTSIHQGVPPGISEAGTRNSPGFECVNASTEARTDQPDRRQLELSNSEQIITNPPEPAEPVSFVVVDGTLKAEIEGLRNEIRNLEETTLQKLEQLRAENRETKQQLLNVIDLLQVERSDQLTSPFPVFQHIPIQTQEDFTQLEESIKSNHGAYSQLLNYLKRGGGSTLSDNVHSLIRSLFSNDMAKTIRLTPVNGKLGFGDSKLADCVREAIHLSHRTDNSLATNKQINDIIGRHFRQCGYVRNAKANSEQKQMDNQKADQANRDGGSDKNSLHAGSQNSGPEQHGSTSSSINSTLSDH